MHRSIYRLGSLCGKGMAPYVRRICGRTTPSKKKKKNAGNRGLRGEHSARGWRKLTFLATDSFVGWDLF